LFYPGLKTATDVREKGKVVIKKSDRTLLLLTAKWQVLKGFIRAHRQPTDRQNSRLGARLFPIIKEAMGKIARPLRKRAK
jgi:hypothetical protein